MPLATKGSRLYGRRWAKARAAHLEQYPWCVMCEVLGRMVRATVVDHKTPHRGDPVLFWDETNWQGLCETDHNAAKQAQEKSGSLRGADSNGVPLDPEHHWNAA